MYTVGSVFYSIYFCVSFPMFYRCCLLPWAASRLFLEAHPHLYARLDEEAGDKWDLMRSVIDSLAAAMTVTILLDFWRLLLPSIDGSALKWDGIPYFD